MSPLEQDVIDKAAITQASSEPIKDINKIKNVMVAYKLSKKEFTSALLKKLLKRLEGKQPSESEQQQLYTDAGTAYRDLINLRNEEKVTLRNIKPEDLPSYIYEGIDADGIPTGNYFIDYLKYSDSLSKLFRVHNLTNNLFVYDETNGTYRSHINQIETHVRNTFKEYSISGKLGESEREIITHIKSMGCVSDYPFIGKFGTIHVLNGCLDIETGTVTPATPDMLYDYRIETEYKPIPYLDKISVIGTDFDIIKTPKPETPELDEFLEIYGTTEPIDVLAKTLWQRAYHDTVKELTIFVGPRDCGKTTLAELVQCTLDGDINKRANVGRTLLHELLQRFGYADLEGKLLNFGDDLPDMFIKNSGRVNEMVGSVVRHIEKKGIDGYDAIVTAYYLFTTNNLPPLDDDDNAIWGKIHLVEFKNVISKNRVPRTTLFTKTIREQLLFRAVEKAISYKKKPYTNSQTPDEVRNLWHESSTDVDEFLKEATDWNPLSVTPLDDIKRHYDGWCVFNNRKRHIKYLTKKLQPFFRKLNTGNVYSLTMISYKPESKQSGVQQSTQGTPA